MSSGQGESSATDTTGLQELEQTLKQLTFTRSKMEHTAATMENLPDELLIKIFIRLFAKQLVQMRCVSKSWNGLLSHPSFVKSHLHRSIRNHNEQIFLVFPVFYEPFTEYSSQSLHLEPTNYIKYNPVDIPVTVMVIGSVNGLVCFSKAYSDIHIWNPSLSAVSAIPKQYSIPPGSHSKISIGFGFGFDPKTDDYKLVKLTAFRDTPNDLAAVEEWLKIEVYSLRKRSWELITQRLPYHITKISDSAFLCVGQDGYLHWQIETVVKTEERKIMAFDMGSEIFREIPLPDTILDSNHSLHRLGVLGGKLCEMTWHDDGAWEVWVMEEYGVPESWVKRHVFSQFNDDDCLLGFTSRNELLLEDKDGGVVLYNPNENKTKKTRTKQSAIRIVEYVDSLVWV